MVCINAGDNIIAGRARTGFAVDRAQSIQVDVDEHRLQVLRGERVLKTWTNEAVDAEKEYRYRSMYAMRITNSGEFWTTLRGTPATSGRRIRPP